ncbi:MAG: TIM barrel protein [Chryseolinea sp.]
MNFSRRQFIQTSSTLTTGLLLNAMDSFAKPLTTPNASSFSLLILATNWGFAGSTEEYCARVKQDGYDGIETWYPNDASEREKLLAALSKHGLKVGFLVGGSDSDYQKHLVQFQTNLSAAAALKPVYINCHSGKDFFSFEQNKTFIDFSTKVSQEQNVPIYHETHRSRILYSAPVARTFIEKIPALRLTLDISHWCNVHESYLSDQAETVKLALSRTDHIHARIGHPEGPQVNDPRAPEWGDALKAHFAWWDAVVEQKKKEGKLITFLTEFGPVDYMPALPYTRQPVANQWEINVHMMQVLRKRYA